MAYGRGPGRPRKVPDTNAKIVFAMRSRDKVWANCSMKEAAAMMKKFDAALKAKKPATWFSLEPHAVSRVRVEAVESVYYLGPA